MFFVYGIDGLSMKVEVIDEDLRQCSRLTNKPLNQRVSARMLKKSVEMLNEAGIIRFSLTIANNRLGQEAIRRIIDGE